MMETYNKAKPDLSDELKTQDSQFLYVSPMNWNFRVEGMTSFHWPHSEIGAPPTSEMAHKGMVKLRDQQRLGRSRRTVQHIECDFRDRRMKGSQ